MKFNSHTLLCLIFIALLSACNNRNELKVASRNFDAEVEQQQNLIFNFNKDIYPDSLLQQWDSTEYIVFSPAVKGRFKWNSSSELVFSPAMGFLPGTAYTAKLTKQLMAKSKHKYGISSEPIKFRTAGLRVMNTHVSYTRGKSMANVMVQLDVDMNYDVKVEDAAAHIKLSSGANGLMTTAINSGIGKTVSLQFLPPNEKDEETPLKIEITKGIAIAKTNIPSENDTVINEKIPSRFNLSVTGIMAKHNGTEGMITVNMSQPVMEENLKEMISLSPAAPFDIALDDAGFTITSTSLKADQTYELTLSSKLEGAFGGRMKNDYSEQVTFGKLQPSISFANNKGMYLSSKGYRNVALNIVNVPKVKVTVVKVYENNLENFFRQGTSGGYYYDDNSDDYGYYDYYNTEELGDVVFTADYETNKLPKLNAARVLHLDFQDKIKGYDGVYVVTVESDEHTWVQQSKILSLSDIGLIVKNDADDMYVFANSIRNATALSGVSISFISTNNQRVYTATTDNDGVAVFRDMKSKAPGFTVGLVTAKIGAEFNFVSFRQAAVGTSRFDVGGRVPNDAGLNAMIYAERNLYRPGETIHISAIVRNEDWSLSGEMPVKLKLSSPNGKEFANYRKILNEQGSAEAAFSLPATAMTGTYTLEVFTGNEVLLNSYAISVEDFMPDRIKATLKIDKTDYKPGDSIRGILQADNLFGTPAAGRNYEVQLNMNKKEFESKAYPDFNFAIRNDFNFTTEFRNGQTNGTGGALASFHLKPELKDIGILQGNVMATVFDETGRPVHRYEHFNAYTQNYFAGMKLPDYYVSTRRPMRIDLLTVDKNNKPQSNAAVQLVIIKKEWHTVIQQDGERYRYISQKEEKIIKQQLLKLPSGISYYNFTPELSGEYEARLSFPGSNSYVSNTFYAWGGGDTQYSSFDVDNEGNVDIKLDKEKYNTGDDMNVLFTTPFEGKMLVTLERNKIIKHFYLSTNNKSASVKLALDDIAVPNVYITATLFRPMDGADMPLTVAHGFKNVPVENTKNHLSVQVALAQKSRSKTKQTITVKTTPNAYVTIAAVDEGILQVKNYETPDAYKYFYQKVALSTSGYDIYPFLLPEVKLRNSSTGGDGAAESDMRVNPMFVNRVKNVSFWSGILQADGSGIVRYDIDVPQFSGDIRVMAIAYKGKAFGGADQHMKVADPIVISTALPRFMSPKDEVIMPVTLSNTTASNTSATVMVTVHGPLGITGSATQTVNIAANKEGRAVFNISAQQAIGAGKVTVSVKAFNETFTHETEISIRPTASLQKIFESGIAAENQNTPLALTSNFIPATAKGTLIIGKTPLIQFTKNISELVHYPYGCVEQTVSAAFPQLYYADLAKNISSNDNTDLNPAYNVQQAILKLQSMQLSNGGLSYWPEGGAESWWGSVYATHFLLEAKKAGYEVNSKSVDRLVQYLKAKLAKRETEILYYNENLKKEIAAKEIAYSLYVLAMAGQPQTPTMNYYKAHPEMLSLDSKYLLAAAYTLSGQPMQAKQVLPPAFEGERARPSFGGSFYSYVRDEAIALNALLDVDPASPQVGVMSRHLSEQLKTQHYINTQENVWGILALGKIARASNQTTAAASITVNGKNIANTAGNTIQIDMKPYLNQQAVIKVKGKGAYYYFWQASGITADGSYKQEDSYMKVRRSYYYRNGTAATGNTFRQNDLIVVKITIEGQYSAPIDNVAITDMLAAGFEIENSRLVGLPDMKWIKNQSTPDYIDIRDDRINFFTSASARPKSFYYMVRAVSPGTYQLGPVQADAMYNGSYHSYNGAGIIKVEQ